MMNFPVFSGIGRRLCLVCGILSVALAGVAWFAWSSLGHVGALVQRIESVRVPQLQRATRTEAEVTRAQLLMRHAMLARNPRELQRALDGIEEKRLFVNQTMADYARSLATPADKAGFAKVPALLDTFWSVAAQDVRMVQSGDKDGAFAFLVDKTVPARTELLMALRDAVKRQDTAVRGDLLEVVAETQRTLGALVGLVAAVIVGLVLLSWHVARVLRRRVAVSRALAERVRDGDLTQAVRDDGARDEFSPLLAALGDMQDALTRIVARVRQNAESVATASAQIASGNNDLSARTEVQASALQQTAASMEQLGAAVRHNADNARQADRLAQDASRVAGQGGDVVTQVVDTMRGIDDASRRIADIIGVIDAIAFQTNILALNAAVEAARAGEQGRGFAVVAGEVRSLAQRSAGAAREIRDLIAASVARVEQGTRFVGTAGETMAEVVGAIRRVTGIVGEISVASQQQSQGVSQVGEAIAQMDQTTQQNAALVEQSAAAADSLRAQAQALVQAVSAFRIEQAGLAEAPVPGKLPISWHGRHG